VLKVHNQFSSWPDVPPGLVVGWALQHQVFCRLVSAAAVWTGGRVLASDTVQISCQQQRVTNAWAILLDLVIY